MQGSSSFCLGFCLTRAATHLALGQKRTGRSGEAVSGQAVTSP